MNSIKRLLYQLKYRICEYFEWFNRDFDPETDSYVIYEENSGKSFDGEITSFWIEEYVVGSGLFNWWYSFRWDTSA